jgi:hypothetical protein
MVMEGIQEWKLRHYLDSEVTIKLLQTLVKKRQEEKRFEKLTLNWALLSFVFVFFLVLYIYFYRMDELTSIRLGLTSIYTVFDDLLIMSLIIAVFVSIFQMNYFKTKHDKAKLEYENLRHEIIERGEELWPKPEQWNNRHVVYEFLQTEYDVNLYHKQKN